MYFIRLKFAYGILSNAFSKSVYMTSILPPDSNDSITTSLFIIILNFLLLVLNVF